MDAKQEAREREREKLLNRLAELQLEEFRETGTFDSTPHFSSIEEVAHRLGQMVSREVQERSAREVASSQTQGSCPACGELCPLEIKRRIVKGIDGPIELDELVGKCRRCRRSFFPSSGSDGI